MGSFLGLLTGPRQGCHTCHQSTPVNIRVSLKNLWFPSEPQPQVKGSFESRGCQSPGPNSKLASLSKQPTGTHRKPTHVATECDPSESGDFCCLLVCSPSLKPSEPPQTPNNLRRPWLLSQEDPLNRALRAQKKESLGPAPGKASCPTTQNPTPRPPSSPRSLPAQGRGVSARGSFAATFDCWLR